MKNLLEETNNEIERLNNLKKVIDKYPDLIKIKDRFGQIYYSSKMANNEVTDLIFQHSCSCCSDAPLFAKPYLEINGIEIFSEPYQFCIGESNDYGMGEIPDQEGLVEMEESGIPASVIQKAKDFLDDNPPKYIEEDY